MTRLTIPANLAAYSSEPARAAWLARLSIVVEQAREMWSLNHVGEPFAPGGQAAWVAPALSADAGEVVLKVVFPHPEARDEADGLRVWAGEGAVRLITAATPDEHTSVLLLERLRPGAALHAREDAEQDAVLAALLPRLWRPPPSGHGFRPLTEMCDAWADGCERNCREESCALDAGLIRAGLELFRSLPRDPTPEVLLCTDLHAENVLSAEREPWLMIDPKPYVGDPTYDVLQHMLNCPARLEDPFGFSDQIARLFELDAERLMRWLCARCVVGAPGRPDLISVAGRLAPRVLR